MFQDDSVKGEMTMVVREKYEQNLSEVQTLLVDLCEMALEAFNRSVHSFVNRDVNQALMILDQDRFINRLEEHIQDEAILLIAKQQPVATDLRRLMVIVSAASDMERIGDHAVNIAKETIRLGNEEIGYSTEKIEHMKELTITMLKDMVQAFTTENLHAAKEISMRDDAVDQLYGEALVSIIETAKSEGASIEQLIQISFICKSIERVADYTTNLAEALFYLLKGRHYELNN